MISFLSSSWDVNILHPRMLLSCLVKIGPLILEKIFNLCQCIFSICYYPPLKRKWLFICSFEFPLPQNIQCKFQLKLSKLFWRRIFLNFIDVFSLFSYLFISPWKRMLPFIWTNLNQLHPQLWFDALESQGTSYINAG